MITRSSAKAKLEFRREQRQERLRKLACRDGLGTPYNLRSTMGRKGGKSNQAGVSKEMGDGNGFDDGEVQPVKLAFLDGEASSRQKESTKEVSECDATGYHCTQSIDFGSHFLAANEMLAIRVLNLGFNCRRQSSA